MKEAPATLPRGKTVSVGKRDEEREGVISFIPFPVPAPLPVTVSTAMPESKRYPGVWIGEDYAQFSHLLDQALQAGDDSQYLATIRAVAQDRSWDKRAEAILHRLEKTRL